MKKLIMVMALALAGCMETVPEQKPVQLTPQQQAQAKAQAKVAVTRFESVIQRVEPVAEAECKRRTQGVNCDYRIVVDDQSRYANAFQMESRQGRPILAFTIPMLLDVKNADELALVMGHEAAHHIEGHLRKTHSDALAGALIFGILGAAAGVDAVDLGAQVGARQYSKQYELEADRLGTVIAKRAGYDPVKGAQYFTRIPDPGNRFLGSHPPNATRIATIRNAAKG